MSFVKGPMIESPCIGLRELSKDWHCHQKKEREEAWSHRDREEKAEFGVTLSQAGNAWCHQKLEEEELQGSRQPPL